MKILFIITNVTQHYGAQILMKDMANALSVNGTDVSVVSIYKTKDADLKLLDSRISVHTIYHNNLINRLYRYSLKVLSLFRKVNPKLGRYYPNRRFKKILAKEQPDYVASFTQPATIIAGLVLKDNNKHIVYHNIDPNKKVAWSNETDQIFKRICSQSKLNIFLNELYCDFVEGDNKIVIPTYFDNDRFNYNDTLKREKVILIVSRMSWVKNIELPIRAFAKIADKYPDWNVHIYSDTEGDAAESILKLISEFDLNDRVIRKDPISEIGKVYNSSSVFCLSSLHEGMSLSLNEAMYFKLPVLVIEDCAINEKIVNEARSGIVSTNDPDVFAQDLEKLIKDKNLRNELGLNGHQYVKEFSKENVLEKWLEAMNQL